MGVKIEEFGAAEPGLGHGGSLFDAVLGDLWAVTPAGPSGLRLQRQCAGHRLLPATGLSQTDLRSAVWHRVPGRSRVP